MCDLSFVLFARPSFVEGIARLADVAGTLNQYNLAESPQEADERAIWADWRQVGMDMFDCLPSFHE